MNNPWLLYLTEELKANSTKSTQSWQLSTSWNLDQGHTSNEVVMSWSKSPKARKTGWETSKKKRIRPGTQKQGSLFQGFQAVKSQNESPVRTGKVNVSVFRSHRETEHVERKWGTKFVHCFWSCFGTSQEPPPHAQHLINATSCVCGGDVVTINRLSSLLYCFLHLKGKLKPRFWFESGASSSFHKIHWKGLSVLKDVLYPFISQSFQMLLRWWALWDYERC